MYEQFFGLREKPFSLTPDTEYFYRYSGHQEALNVLLVALRNGEGFVRVSGEVGTGKTLLCRQLLKVLQDDCETAYLPNPLLTPKELYQAIVSELELEIPAGATVQQMNQRILEELIRLRDLNRPLVVLIDEAQAMPLQSLEALRLLSNLETEKEKLLHIFFFAQPEFEQRLAKNELRQLRQRITFSYTLSALNQRELGGYLEHRLKIAGYQGGALFQDSAARLLYSASCGVPRLINLLAHKALLAAYGKGRRSIDRRLMEAAIKDTNPQKETTAGAVVSGFMLKLGKILVAAIVTLLVLRGLQ
ncbi:MAG: AAA family ATPase [Desulfuromonadaceae bacterium]|nr:AAA family ATPase [Desulfuromonadaceae bacterium]